MNICRKAFAKIQCAYIIKHIITYIIKHIIKTNNRECRQGTMPFPQFVKNIYQKNSIASIIFNLRSWKLVC